MSTPAPTTTIVATETVHLTIPILVGILQNLGRINPPPLNNKKKKKLLCQANFEKKNCIFFFWQFECTKNMPDSHSSWAGA